MAMQPLPERVVAVEVPGDRLGVSERGLLALAVARRLLEVEQVHHVILDYAGAGGLDRALVAAVIALHRARHVQAAQLLDGVVAHAAVEEIAPGVRECPERRRHMRAHCRALRARSALAPAAVHLLAHLVIHLLQREIADALLCRHGLLLMCFSSAASRANRPAA